MAIMQPLPPADLAHVLERGEAPLRALRGARLFVTGGTGFFGVWLLETLAAANARLQLGLRATVLSRDPAAFAARAPRLAADASFDWLRGDARDFGFPGGAFSHVIHGAATASAALNDARPDEMRGTIVEGTRRALAFAAHSGARDLLFVSSGAVYGPQPPALSHVGEDRIAQPGSLDTDNAYAEGKRVAEALCAGAAAQGLRPKIARCFAFVGPHLPLDAHFAAGNFLRDALEGRAIRIQGDGRPYRSYLHSADLVAWLLAILVRGEPLRPYNVGSDQAVSIEDLARRVARLAAPAVEVSIHGKPGSAPPPRYVPSTVRARRELGLEAWLDLDAALQRTFAWLQSTR